LRLSDRFGCFVALVARAGVPLAGTSTMMCALSRGTTEVNMNKHVLGGMIAAAVLWPALTSAQTTVIETTGSTPPDEVVTYVQRERVPSVAIEGDLRVGATLPGTVQLRTIPRQDKYGFAVVNNRRVIVEPSTRRVIRIIE